MWTEGKRITNVTTSQAARKYSEEHQNKSRAISRGHYACRGKIQKKVTHSLRTCVTFSSNAWGSRHCKWQNMTSTYRTLVQQWYRTRKWQQHSTMLWRISSMGNLKWTTKGRSQRRYNPTKLLARFSCTEKTKLQKSARSNHKIGCRRSPSNYLIVRHRRTTGCSKQRPALFSCENGKQSDTLAIPYERTIRTTVNSTTNP